MIIVGAGPAGLATAAQLRQLGHQPTVLDQSSDLGGSWPTRWDGLRLHTMRALSGLPGAPIPRRYGRWVSRHDFVTYLTDYAERFQIQPELGVRVTGVDRQDDGSWQVATESAGTHEQRSTESVVIATGYSRVPVIPDWPGRERFGKPLTHTADYRNAAAYAGRQVLVVGAGNSASEIAAELVEGGASVQMSVRTPPNIVRRSTFGVPSQLVGLSMKRAPESIVNSLSAVLRRVSVPDLSEHGLPAPRDGFTQFLRTRTIPVLDHGFVDHVRAGRITIVAAVESLTEDEVILSGGRRLRPDAVICGTGFRTGLEGIVGHLDVLDHHGRPYVEGEQTMPGAPGLYFVGMTAVLSGLLHEIGLEAREVAHAVAARSAVSDPVPIPRG